MTRKLPLWLSVKQAINAKMQNRKSLVVRKEVSIGRYIRQTPSRRRSAPSERKLLPLPPLLLTDPINLSARPHLFSHCCCCLRRICQTAEYNQCNPRSPIVRQQLDSC